MIIEKLNLSIKSDWTIDLTIKDKNWVGPIENLIEDKIIRNYLNINKAVFDWIKNLKWPAFKELLINELSVHCHFHKLNIYADFLESLKIKKIWIFAHMNIHNISLQKENIPDCLELNIDIINDAKDISIDWFPKLMITWLPDDSKIWRLNIINIFDTKLYLKSIKADYCSLTGYSSKIENTDLYISGSIIEHFEIKSSWLVIENWSIERCRFNNWIWDNLKFNNLTLLSSTFIKNSFIDIDFPSDRNKSIFRDVDFHGNSFSNVNWWEYFSEQQLLPYSENNVIKFKSTNIPYPSLKELYRRLKFEYDSVWNKTEANKFFAKEMEYYEKSLTWKEWDKKTISFIQRFSNNYGNSWIRPFLWIIGISFLYTFSFDCWNFNCACWRMQDWNCFSSHWLKNVSQFPTELKNAKDWWFFFYAVIMGSLFYQLLVALRRISQR